MRSRACCRTTHTPASTATASETRKSPDLSGLRLSDGILTVTELRNLKGGVGRLYASLSETQKQAADTLFRQQATAAAQPRTRR
jgi:hypothetical protein